MAEEAVYEPPRIIQNRTSILIGRSHDDKEEEDECSYCHGKRTVDNMETGEFGVKEEGCKYHKLGFTSTKMRVDDLEKCLNNGFTRCGTYVYMRTNYKSCCEIFQYRVDVNEFKISASQK